MTNDVKDRTGEDLSAPLDYETAVSFLVGGEGAKDLIDAIPAGEEHTRLTPEEETNYWRIRMGRLIRQQRLALGFSQKKLADLFGIARQESIGQYERGIVGLSASDIPRLARCLGVPISYLYGETEAAGLSDWERSLLEQARSLSVEDRNRAIHAFRALYDYADQTGTLRQKVPKPDVVRGTTDLETGGEK